MIYELSYGSHTASIFDPALNRWRGTHSNNSNRHGHYQGLVSDIEGLGITYLLLHRMTGRERLLVRTTNLRMGPAVGHVLFFTWAVEQRVYKLISPNVNRRSWLVRLRKTQTSARQATPHGLSGSLNTQSRKGGMLSWFVMKAFRENHYDSHPLPHLFFFFFLKKRPVPDSEVNIMDGSGHMHIYIMKCIMIYGRIQRIHWIWYAKDNKII